MPFPPFERLFPLTLPAVRPLRAMPVPFPVPVLFWRLIPDPPDTPIPLPMFEVSTLPDAESEPVSKAALMPVELFPRLQLETVVDPVRFRSIPYKPSVAVMFWIAELLELK